MQSAAVVLPEAASASTSLVSAGEGAREPEARPYKLPDDTDIFLFRKRERERREMETVRRRNLPVHQKVTQAGRTKATQADLRRRMRDDLGEEERRRAVLGRPAQSNAAWRLPLIKDCNVDKETTREFINKRREMFLLEHSLAVKHQEIKRLEDLAVAEQRKLTCAEAALEDEAVRFEESLKESDKKTVEAINMDLKSLERALGKSAEQETKVKLEKLASVKRMTSGMVANKSDVSKLEDRLQKYILDKEFLFKLSLPEWQETQLAKSAKMATSAIETTDKENVKEREKDKAGRNMDRRGSIVRRSLPPLRDRMTPSRQSRNSVSPGINMTPVPETDTDCEEAAELHFTDPRQLLEIITELEEESLSLIQNSCEEQESLEEFRKGRDRTHKTMEQKTGQLAQQIEIMTQTIERKRERAAELELRARLFNYGKYTSEDQDGMLDSLGRKVEEVNRSCVGDSEANLSTLQMLTAVEAHVGELLEAEEAVPQDRLLAATKAVEKERRRRLCDEKQRQQRQHQEDRLKRALERTQAVPKKTTVKRLTARPRLPERTLKSSTVHDVTDKDEEYLYFFT